MVNNKKEDIRCFNLRIDENMKAYIEKEAKKEGISQNQLIKDAIQLYACNKIMHSY